MAGLAAKTWSASRSTSAKKSASSCGRSGSLMPATSSIAGGAVRQGVIVAVPGVVPLVVVPPGPFAEGSVEGGGPHEGDTVPAAQGDPPSVGRGRLDGEDGSHGLSLGAEVVVVVEDLAESEAQLA